MYYTALQQCKLAMQSKFNLKLEKIFEYLLIFFWINWPSWKSLSQFFLSVFFPVLDKQNIKSQTFWHLLYHGRGTFSVGLKCCIVPLLSYVGGVFCNQLVSASSLRACADHSQRGRAARGERDSPAPAARYFARCLGRRSVIQLCQFIVLEGWGWGKPAGARTSPLGLRPLRNELWAQEVASGCGKAAGERSGPGRGR